MDWKWLAEDPTRDYRTDRLATLGFAAFAVVAAGYFFFSGQRSLGFAMLGLAFFSAQVARLSTTVTLLQD